ncbi:hypothetical protein K402DRAFT_401118 [Aulographum hederae CBS 113979]|uniref:Deoxyribonuclease NucA/NucB domain-containing protein n=1 Tax=Aulographum hederae CBS 113979 TaxID=1176131 RepID=A0A6G1HB14_9PEZI|nr:hypothetical protein K402DRAFT_401118 [Aulographum hederae CBS 113979]
MSPFKSFTTSLCLYSLLFSAALAAPTAEVHGESQLVKRDPGDSKEDPLPATFDISNWPDIAEENCFAMLCLRGGDRVYQRVGTSGDRGKNYQASGAKFKPFHGDQLESRHTAQINGNTISAEEFPFESTQQGGEIGYVFPATEEQQQRQSGALSTTYQNQNIGYNKWFEITYIGGPMGLYCTALFSKPPDFSVCNDDRTTTLFGTAGVKLANFAYQVVRAGAVPYAFKHLAGPSKGQITRRSEGSEATSMEAEKE